MSASPQAPLPAAPLSIFIVENHADTMHYLRMFLEQLGHEVHGAATMREALEKLPSTPCDVLISDIGLSDGDGWELLRRAHLPASVYAVAMSGFGMGTDQSRSKAAGFRHHLLKPFMPDQLEGFLEEARLERAERAAA